MARHAIVGSFTILVAVVALGQARAQPSVCCKSLCANGIPNCESIPDCAGTCANFCAGFSSRCVGATPSACPDGQDPLDCAEGCQPVCPPTFTPTSTPTGTPVPQGGACATPSQCGTGFCVDNVCCNSACTDPLTKCNLPGQVGTCASAAAEAPTLTPWGLIAGLVLLAGSGVWAIRRRRT